MAVLSPEINIWPVRPSLVIQQLPSPRSGLSQRAAIGHFQFSFCPDLSIRYQQVSDSAQTAIVCQCWTMLCAFSASAACHEGQ